MPDAILLPQSVSEILALFQQSGFSAYVVGGCVRDSLMGNVPADWDICTNALVHQTKQIFSSYPIIDTGIAHGTVTLMYQNTPFEITTFRKEGKYSDNRRPDCVCFCDDIVQDLSRRDFTINAMAYNPQQDLIDPFGGKADLQTKTLRCVGNANQRFSEDALRILRGMRFLSRFGFSADKECQTALHECKYLLLKISPERIFSELCKMLQTDFLFSVFIEYSDVLFVCFPPLAPLNKFLQYNPYHDKDVWQHTIKAVCSAENDLTVRLALLFHDVGKPECISFSGGVAHFYKHANVGKQITETLFHQYKTSNQLRENVCELIAYHSSEIPPVSATVKRWLNKMGETQFFRLLKVKSADICAQCKNVSQRLQQVSELQLLAQQILQEQSCFSIKDLALNGTDLLELGIPQGKAVGEMLNHLLEQVICETVENTKTALTEYVLSR